MVKILNGHNIDIMAAMAPESVHVCVTSPPYFGLRDYKTAPQIWAPLNKIDNVDWKTCEHDFVDEMVSAELRRGLGMEELSKRYRGGGKKAGKVPKIEAVCGFCLKCGAWRGHLGLEPNPELYVWHMVLVFREVKRVLHKSGTVWLNLGDSYATPGTRQGNRDGGLGEGREDEHRKVRHSSSDKSTLHQWKNGGRREEAEIPIVSRGKRIPRGNGRWNEGGNNPATGDLKPKDLIGIPWMVVFALRADGWYWRQRLPWLKRNPMPESASDRPSTACEEIFLLSKSEDYFYDGEAVKMSMAEYERLRRLRESEKGLATVFNIARDDQTRDANQGVNGVVRSANARQEQAVTGTRSRRNTDWFFESWQGMVTDEDGWPLALVINTAPYKDAHFATFPPRLVEPMIKAGTSACGCCEKCGAPWERVIEKGMVDLAHQRACGSDAEGKYDGEAVKDYEEHGAQNASDAKRNILAGMMSKRSVGWVPTCKCAGYRVRSTSSRRMRDPCLRAAKLHEVDPNSKFQKNSNASRVQMLRDSARALGGEYGNAGGEPKIDRRRQFYRGHWQKRIEAKFPRVIPCTAFDPFGGSGTTAKVANEQGRKAVIIDLSADYCELADKRTAVVTPALALFD